MKRDQFLGPSGPTAILEGRFTGPMFSHVLLLTRCWANIVCIHTGYINNVE